MNSVRIGFVGVGGMGQCAHLRNYATLSGCEVVAIAEVRRGLGEKVAQHYGVPRVYENHIQMLESEELDGIVASQPFNRHGVLLPELFSAGVPVFTEKPLAASVQTGEKIVAALEAAGTWQMVGYHKRSDPASMYAKAEIDRLKQTGELGKLRYVRLLMPPGDWVANGFIGLITTDEPYPALKHDPPAPDMDEKTSNEYQTFVNYYIHQINLLRYFLGEPYRVSYAHPSGVLLVAETESGAAGVIEMSPYQTTVDWQESAFVAFERGWINIELPAPLAINRPGKVTIYRDPGGEETPSKLSPQLPWVHAMRRQAINFVQAIRGEAKPPCEAAEALEDLRVARDYIRLLRGK